MGLKLISMSDIFSLFLGFVGLVRFLATFLVASWQTLSLAHST